MLQRRATVAEIIFAVDFKPANLWLLLDNIDVVLSTQADPGVNRDRTLSRVGHGDRRLHYFAVVLPPIFSQLPFGTYAQSLVLLSVFD